MNVTQLVEDVLDLLSKYGPEIPIAISDVMAIVAAFKKALGETDDAAVVADLEQLIVDAKARRAQADLAATGQDPQ